MDTPLSRQLQQAWLYSQLNKQSLLPHDLPSPLSDSWSSPLHDSFSAASPLPSPDDPSSISAHQPLTEVVSENPNNNMPTSFDDMLLDPVLDYINDLLMDEEMEDRHCMHECIAYQAIINNFYEILDEKPPMLPCSGPELSPSSAGSEIWDERMPSFDPRPDDYSWIDEVLVEDPSISQLQSAVAISSPWLLDSTSTSSSEQEVKLWSFDSSSGGSPYSRDSAVFSPGLRDNSSTTSASQSSGSSVHDSGIPGSQSVLPTEPVFAGVDSGAGNEGSWQSVPRDDAVDSKFTRVRSEDLRYSSSQFSLVNENGNGGFRRAISDKILDRERQSQEVGRSFHGNGSSYHPVNGGHNPRPQKFEQQFEQQGREVVASAEKGEEISSEELSFVKNEYLKAEKTAKIYGEWSPGKGGACVEGKKKEKPSNNGSNVKKSGTPEAVDLRAMLVSCAQAVAANDLRTANGLLEEVRHHASPHGTASQRLAHYFSEGLLARLAGTGTRLYTVMSNNRPSAAKMLKAMCLKEDVCPYGKIAHYFANHSILKIAEGASRLHIVDYGILYGFQWPSLMSALAERKGGPPFLHITGIEFPHPGLNPAERVEDTGRRLAEYARTYGLPFEYTPIASKWEDVEPASLHRKEGEVLAVNCMFRLRHLLDESVVSSSPRQKVLNRMRSLKPDILLVGVTNAGFNAPFFVSRFREALYHYSSKFDMLDTTIDSDNPFRLMCESELLGRDILNIVACEGPERVERPETYRQWQARIQRTGFQLLPLNPMVVSKARAVVKSYHKDFGVDDDSKWILLGWKGRIVSAISAWNLAK